ncbi:MAG: hypothetical protein AAGU27_27525, partial [Dehalobacterium sp.]
RWFEASTCMVAPKGLPSSSIEHGYMFYALLRAFHVPSWHTTGTCLRTGKKTGPCPHHIQTFFEWHWLLGKFFEKRFGYFIKVIYLECSC